MREASHSNTYGTVEEPDRMLSFEYWVQATDYDPDGLSIGPNALRLNGGSIRGQVAPLDADLNLEHAAFANDPDLKVDGGLDHPATILEIFFNSAPWNGDTYRQGEGVSVGVWFSKGVTPDLPHSSFDQRSAGMPTVPTMTLRIGEHERDALYYAREHDGSALYFRYDVQEEDRDENGIGIPANALKTNGVRILDFGGADADLRHAALGDDPSQKVNGEINPNPVVTDVVFESLPKWGATYAAGETIEVGVSFSQHIDRLDDSRGWPYLELTIGAQIRSAEMRAVGRAWAEGYRYTFYYEVLPEDRDANGLSIGPNALHLMATDAVGRPFDTSLEGYTVVDDRAHQVDGRILAGLPGALRALELGAGGAAVTVDVTPAFYGDVTDYSVTSSTPRVATASMAGPVITVTPLRQGTTTVEVVARRGSRTARVSFDVAVVTALQTVGALPAMQLIIGGSGASIDVAAAFQGGASSYTARSTNTEVATATVSGTTVEVAPVGEGQAVVEVMAGNVLGTATQSFVVAVVRDPAEVRVLDAALSALGRSLLASVATTLESRFRAAPEETVFAVAGRQIAVRRETGGPGVHRGRLMVFGSRASAVSAGRGSGPAGTWMPSAGGAGAGQAAGGRHAVGQSLHVVARRLAARG